MNKGLKKGRGAKSKPKNRFEKHSYIWEDEFLEYAHKEGEQIESSKTKFITVQPRTILSVNSSPDVPFNPNCAFKNCHAG